MAATAFDKRRHRLRERAENLFRGLALGLQSLHWSSPLADSRRRWSDGVQTAANARRLLREALDEDVRRGNLKRHHMWHMWKHVEPWLAFLDSETFEVFDIAGVGVGVRARRDIERAGLPAALRTIIGYTGVAGAAANSHSSCATDGGTRKLMHPLSLLNHGCHSCAVASYDPHNLFAEPAYFAGTQGAPTKLETGEEILVHYDDELPCRKCGQ